MQWLVLVALLVAPLAVSALFNSTSVVINNDGLNIYPCLQVNHREPDIDSSMMGQWYVVEVIHHQDESKRRVSQAYDSCPKLTLFMPENTIIRIHWKDKVGDIVYNFKMVDPENRGFWLVWRKQSGSMLNTVNDQFSGSVQVMEAIPSRMVLTFCSSQPASNGHTHYSIVMVRNITIPHDTRDVRQTLLNYRLPETSVQQTCRNEPSMAALSLPSYTLFIFVSVYFVVFHIKLH